MTVVAEFQCSFRAVVRGVAGIWVDDTSILSTAKAVNEILARSLENSGQGRRPRPTGRQRSCRCVSPTADVIWLDEADAVSLA
jgi:hypothetical protein